MRKPFGAVALLVGTTVALLFAAASCGGGSGGGLTQMQARDQLADATCDWAAGCGEIGTSGTYTSRDDCLTQAKNFWQGVVTPEMCSGTVDVSQLNTCKTAISITECGNLVDVLLTLGSKCPVAKICPAPGADAGAD